MPSALRKLLLLGLSLGAGLAGVEALAWWMNLDGRQGEAFVGLGTSTMHGGEDLGLPLTPRGLQRTATGLDTPFGPCQRDFAGRTLLVLGDSTTVQSTIHGQPTDIVSTWPLFLGRELGVDWQVCVLAEMGFHPSDHEQLLAVVRGHLPADLQAVILLCENDLGGQRERLRTRFRGEEVAGLKPTAMRAWPTMGTGLLWRRSQAWRYLSFRMAERTGEAVVMPIPVVERSAEEAPAALAEELPLTAWYLPRLDGQDKGALARQVAERAGVPLRVVELPDPPSSVARQPDDKVHLNEAGHRVVAAQVGAWLGEG